MFLSSLDLLLEVFRIWAPKPLGPKIKGPVKPNLSGTYPGVGEGGGGGGGVKKGPTGTKSCLS